MQNNSLALCPLQTGWLLTLPLCQQTWGPIKKPSANHQGSNQGSPSMGRTLHRLGLERTQGGREPRCTTRVERTWLLQTSSSPGGVTDVLLATDAHDTQPWPQKGSFQHRAAACIEMPPGQECRGPGVLKTAVCWTRGVTFFGASQMFPGQTLTALTPQ